MRVLGVSLTALLIAGMSPAADKPYPIFTAKHFTDSMKLLGPNFAGVNSALARNDFEGAKARLIRSREVLAITITFWRDRHNDAAITALRDTLSRMDALDTMLSADRVDANAAAAQLTQIGAGCSGCHDMYRDTVPGEKGYRFKEGLAR